MNTARVVDQMGEIQYVRCVGEFAHTISGESFDFVITLDLSGVGLNVTHKQSGQRVCKIPDSLDGIAWDNEELKQRAIAALSGLVEKYGESRTASVLRGARDLPPML